MKRFRNARQPGPQFTPTMTDSQRAIDFGWRSHSAVQDWTRSVDSKASIVLAVEAAVSIAPARSLFRAGGTLEQLNGWWAALAISSVALLVASVGLCLAVVFPRLKRRKLAKSPGDGLIYFGHLKSKSPGEIQAALASLTAEEELRQLSTQLTTTSEVAWNKHAALQASIAFFALGVALLIITLAITG